MITSRSIRKKLSYIMLPVMVVYTVMPNMSYGSETYTQTKSSDYKSESDNTTASDIARKAAEEINKETLRKTTEALKDKTPSSSAASNYTMGIGAEVNAQTGQLDITFNDVKLAGMSEDTAIDLGISNGGTTDEIYGVPAGWKFSIDYIDKDEKKLHMNGSQSYMIDPTFYSYDSNGDKYYSGLRYCTSKGIKFERNNNDTALPYDSGLSYRYILTTNKGNNEYFDFYGKLICQDDRFGNHIIYNYDTKTGNTPYEARLSGLTDSFGQEIGIKCGHRIITITMPDARTVVYDFSSDEQIVVTGVTGKKACLYLDGKGRVKRIQYPTGGSVEYRYDECIHYSLNGQTYPISGITQVIQHPDESNSIVTEYKYEQNLAGPNFTGIGLCDYSSEEDALMQSPAYKGNSYKYTTTVTSQRSEDCGGEVKSEQIFNFLHLPLRSRVYSKAGLTEINTQYAGESAAGSFSSWDNLKSNYNLPAKVTSTTGGREHLVVTAYDDYSRPVSVIKYDNGSESSKTVTQYFNCYDNMSSQSIHDSIDKTTTTVTNTLSSDGKYIASSKASINKNNASEKTTATKADEHGRITSSTISTSGGTLKNSSETSTTTTSYAMNGNILTVTNKDDLGNSSSKAIDIRNGNIISETDARGNSVNYTYDPTGLIVTKTYPDESSETIDSSNPNKVVASSSNGMIKTSILDGFGRVIEESDNFGGKNTVQYNELGKPSVKTDTFGHSIKYTYDYQGRETSETDYLKNVKKIVYDDGAQTATEYINGIKASISYYDDNGNVTKQTSLLSSKNTVSNATYNGKNLEIASSLSLEGSADIASSVSDYDIDGKLLTATVKTNDGTNGTSVYALSLFGDVINRNTTFSSVSPGVDPKYKGQTISSETKVYNSIGKLTSLTNQANQVITYTYDPNGNLASMTDFAGNTFTYAYDNMNRMITMSGPEYTISNDYFGVEHKGRDGKLKARNLLSKKNGKFIDSISYDYDDHGRLSSVIYMNGKSMSMSYDEYDRVTSMIDFAGIETIYTYDNTENGVPDNITSVSNKFGSALYSYYIINDNPLLGDGKTLKEVSYSNGVTIIYKYETSSDKAPKLASLETYGKANGLMSGSYYTYDTQDRVSSLTQKSDTEPENSNCNNTRYFTYNDMNQLIGEVVKDVKGQIVTSTSYTFDLNGNITKKIIKDGKDNLRTSNIYTYNEIDQLLSWKEKVSGKVNTYRYDLNGNMISITEGNGIIKQFTYNSLNQLIEYKDQGVDVCYEYNAESLRACKYFAGNSSNRIKYYYSQNGEIMNEEDNTGLKTSYLIAGGKVLRAVIPSTVNSQQLTDNVSWYIKNGKDVVATIDDKTQKNTNIYNYNAYGEDTDLNHGGSVIPKKNTFDINDNPYKYSGYYLDEESGMYYLQARYYSPELMRFISRDTYDLSNRYAYCDGDPISNIDPNGHMSQWVNYLLGGLGILASLIGCAFTGGSSLAFGTAAFGALLGAGSLVTQVEADRTGDKTLQLVSMGLGIASMATDLAGGVGGGIAMAKAAKVAKAAEAAEAAETAKVAKVFENFPAEMASESKATLSNFINNEQEVRRVSSLDITRTFIERPSFVKEGEPPTLVSKVYSLEQLHDTPIMSRLIGQDTRLSSSGYISLARASAAGKIIPYKDLAGGIDSGIWFSEKGPFAWMEERQLGIGVMTTVEQRGEKFIATCKLYRVAQETTNNKVRILGRLLYSKMQNELGY